MREIKMIRLSVAIVVIMTMSFIAHYTKATAMIIDESHKNALQSLLKDQKLAFGSFDALAFLGVRNFHEEEDIGVKREIFDSRSKETKERARKANVLDAYFRARNMPMEGFGKQLVEASEKYNLDWRLLPALAIRESSGGKFACDQNPFGWASCNVDFESIDQAIEIVAWNLGGQNPRTKQYYGGDIRGKLYYYNGSIINGYEAQIVHIMKKIADEETTML